MTVRVNIRTTYPLKVPNRFVHKNSCRVSSKVVQRILDFWPFICFVFVNKRPFGSVCFNILSESTHQKHSPNSCILLVVKIIVKFENFENLFSFWTIYHGSQWELYNVQYLQNGS